MRKAKNMLLKSHRLIGVIRIESPIMEIAGDEDDDSTIGGLLASFAQRSLLSDESSRWRWPSTLPRQTLVSSSATRAGTVRANLRQLSHDLEHELAALGN